MALLVTLLFPVTLSSCDSDSSATGGAPIDLTVRLSSPNGAEGAMIVALDPVLGASTPVEGTLYETGGQDRRVMVIANPAGSLSFQVTLPAEHNPPNFTILQVSGPNDELRADLSGYTLEFTP